MPKIHLKDSSRLCLVIVVAPILERIRGHAEGNLGRLGVVDFGLNLGNIAEVLVHSERLQFLKGLRGGLVGSFREPFGNAIAALGSHAP